MLCFIISAREELCALRFVRKNKEIYYNRGHGFLFENFVLYANEKLVKI